MAINHGLLGRMQSPVSLTQIFNREDCHSIKRWQKPDAGINGFGYQLIFNKTCNNDSTCAAITFCASLLGTVERLLVAKVAECRGGELHTGDLNGFHIEQEPNGAELISCGGYGGRHGILVVVAGLSFQCAQTLSGFTQQNGPGGRLC